MAERSEPEVFAALCEIINEVKKIDRPITREDDLRKLELDSLDVINYLFSVEERFEQTITVEMLEEKKLASVGAMAAHLCGAA